jgi:putative sugar O-methyltransferase
MLSSKKVSIELPLRNQVDAKFPLLARMLSDMETAPEICKPTQFWRNASSFIVQDLLEHGVEDFRRLKTALTFFVPTYGFPGWLSDRTSYQSLIAALASLQHPDRRLELRLLRFLAGEKQAYADYRVYLAARDTCALFLDRADESSIGNPLEQYIFGEAHFSRSMLNYLLGLCFLKSQIDTQGIRVVLEVGGGFGTLGEILLGDKRNNCFYINVDIPPTAFVSTWYLQKLLGVENVGVYEDLEKLNDFEIEHLQHRYKAIVLCPWQLPKLKGIVDLFVNFISFQEMEPFVVRNYLSHAERLCVGHVLMRNLREGKQKATTQDSLGVCEPIRGQDYDAFLPCYRLIGTNTEPFGFKTVDGFHSELRIYGRNC